MSIICLVIAIKSVVPGFKLIFYLMSGMFMMLIATLLSLPLVMIGIGLVGGVIMLLGVLEVITRVI